MSIRKTMSVVISVLIIVVPIGCLFLGNATDNSDSPLAEDGVLNLDLWDQGKNTTLDGQWEFYPEILIDPVHPSDTLSVFSKGFEKFQKRRQVISVPGNWADAVNTPINSGTYRLIINVPEDGKYGIKTGTIRTSCRIFLNGRETAVMGNPSIDREKYIPGSRYNIAFTESENRTIELIVQVSSYDYRAGGILKSIKFGSFDEIIKQSNKSRAADGAIITICLVISFLFFFQWFSQRRDMYMLYFGCAGFSLSVYLSTMNEQLLNMLVSYSFYGRVYLQIAMMILVAFCFLQFVLNFFEDYISSKFGKVLSIVLLSMLLFLFNNPANKIFIPVGVSQTFISLAMISTYAYILWIMAKSIYYGDRSLEYILMVTSAFFTYWFIVILKMLFEMEIRHISSVVILILMISVAQLMNHRVSQNYIKVKTFTEDLVISGKMKNDFLIKTSRRLKKPLSTISDLIRTMQEGQSGSLNFRQQENLIAIQHESRRIIRLVDDLLDASLVEVGKMELSFTPVDIHEVVEEVMHEIKLLIPVQKQLKISNLVYPEPPRINADRDKLRQIVYNLLHNAVKFTNSGTITVSATFDDVWAKIEISDTGRGIEEKNKSRVFDMFYHDEEEGQEEGLGLGLTIAQRLIEIQGGKMYFESKLKEGSSFYIILPLAVQKDICKDYEDHTTKEQMKQTGTEQEKRKDIENRTILIIDDVDANRENMSLIISDIGGKALLANSSNEAMDILKTNKVDLVILNFLITGVPGDIVCRKIREKYTMAELPLLVLNVSDRLWESMGSNEYGISGLVKSPIQKDELIFKIQSMLLMKTSVEDGLKREFQYFYSQISPHFLYNTLNTIIGLSNRDTENARKALFNFATYLRGKLDIHRQENLVSFESELELVTAYLEIEQMRYKERLKVEWDIEDDLSTMIPPLTLQPLIENSVRYGMKSKNHVSIKISAKKNEEGNVEIVLEDDGPGMDHDKQKELLEGKSEGFGFTTVIKRINIIEGAHFSLESKLGRGTKIKIRVPEVTLDESYFN